MLATGGGRPSSKESGCGCGCGGAAQSRAAAALGPTVSEGTRWRSVHCEASSVPLGDSGSDGVAAIAVRDLGRGPEPPQVRLPALLVIDGHSQTGDGRIWAVSMLWGRRGEA